jgi:hypothetical protein
LEFGEPDVEKLQRSISHRQFLRWVIFDRIHPIDSRERNDAIVARIGALILTQHGAKDITEEKLNTARFIPKIRAEKEPRRRRSKKMANLDDAIFEAFGKSDGQQRR